MSKYGAFSGPYFSAFRLDTERYEVPLRIQSKCRKIRTRENSVFDHFSRSVIYFLSLLFPWLLCACSQVALQEIFCKLQKKSTFNFSLEKARHKCFPVNLMKFLWRYHLVRMRIKGVKNISFKEKFVDVFISTFSSKIFLSTNCYSYATRNIHEKSTQHDNLFNK